VRLNPRSVLAIWSAAVRNRYQRVLAALAVLRIQLDLKSTPDRRHAAAFLAFQKDRARYPDETQDMLQKILAEAGELKLGNKIDLARASIG